MKICGIYKITSPKGRVYIGQSVDIETRWKQYKFLNCKSQSKIYRSLKKHGVENHTFEIIEQCDFDDLVCRERYWQDFYDVLNGGLNLRLTECGELKIIMSDETKEKLRIANTGKKRSEETKQKLREMKGEKASWYGRKHSDETKEKISKAHIGKIVSDETREKQRQNNLGENSVWYGKKHSNATKKKMSDSSKGEKNPASKLVLHLETGIFYSTAKEASESCCMNNSTFYAYISGRIKKEHFNYKYV